MKICGMLLIGIVGVCLGLFPAMKLQKRAKRLQSYDSMIGTVTEQIRYTATPIYEIFTKLSCDKEWQALRKYVDSYCDQREGFATFLQEDALLNGLQKDDYEILIRWYDGLGKSDIQGQVIHCNQYREEIRNRLTLAKQDAQVKGKLFTTLGITGSLAFSLMWF